MGLVSNSHGLLTSFDINLQLNENQRPPLRAELLSTWLAPSTVLPPSLSLRSPPSLRLPLLYLRLLQLPSTLQHWDFLLDLLSSLVLSRLLVLSHLVPVLLRPANLNRVSTTQLRSRGCLKTGIPVGCYLLEPVQLTANQLRQPHKALPLRRRPTHRQLTQMRRPGKWNILSLMWHDWNSSYRSKARRSNGRLSSTTLRLFVVFLPTAMI